MNSDPFAKTVNGSIERQLLADASREDIVVQALQECQAAMDAGEPINREAILAKYPTIRDELSACLEGLELMEPAGGHDKTLPSDGGDPQGGRHLSPSATLGDFRIQRELGRGGMGVVYEAEQLSVGRKVALKVLPYAAMLDKRQVARFQNEARAAASLEHPNIVPVYFVGNERGVYYYAMRLIDGKNLSEVMEELRGDQSDAPLSQVSSQLLEAKAASDLARADTQLANAETVRNKAADDSTSLASNRSTQGRVYFESIARLVKQAAEALDFAHSHGIIHRDIKPANIMLDEVGDAWVTDFGLARIEADAGMTMTGDLIGTLRYMSPEQTLAKRVVVDHRSDIYSLGATLYELLTLCPLFDGEDRAALLRQIAFDEPKSPAKIVKGVPADLETIVLKSLQKNPSDRYATAQELAEDLDRFLSNQPVLARRTPLSQRCHMWTRRHPATATALAAVSAVILVATAALALLAANHERTLRTKEKDAGQRIAATLAEREQALDTANANLNEALNAIDRFLVEMSGEGGSELLASAPQRENLLRASFEIYEKLEAANQTTPELDRRKLFSMMKALGMRGIAHTSEGDALRNQALELADRLLLQTPRDTSVLFAKLYLTVRPDNHLGEGIPQQRTRAKEVHDLIEEQVNDFGSAKAMIDSVHHLETHMADALVSVMRKANQDSRLPPELQRSHRWRLMNLATSLLDRVEVRDQPSYSRLASHAANLAERIGDARLALNLLQKAQELSDEVPISGSMIGLVERSEGRDEAIEFCREQLRRYEQRFIKYPKAERDWLYDSYQVRLADYISQTPDLQSLAETMEREMLRKHPLVRRHRLLARLFQKLGNEEKELHHYEQAAILDFGNFSHFDKKAYALYLKNGDYASAGAVFAGSNEAHKQKRLAVALFKEGDYEAALKAYRKSFELSPSGISVVAWITPESLGPDPGFQHPIWVAGRKKLLEHMVESMDELIGSEPENGIYWHFRASAKRHLGHFDEALQDNLRAAELRSTEENQSEYAYCLASLAAAYKALGRYEEETEALLKAVDARANHENSRSENSVGFYLSYVASSYERRRMYEAAKNTYRRIFELEPDNAMLHNNVAWQLATSNIEELRDGDLAVEFATKACELTDWKNAGFLDTLAAAYAESGDFDSAIKWQSKAMELVPELVHAELRSRLELYEQEKPYRQSE